MERELERTGRVGVSRLPAQRSLGGTPHTLPTSLGRETLTNDSESRRNRRASHAGVEAVRESRGKAVPLTRGGDRVDVVGNAAAREGAAAPAAEPPSGPP